VTLSIYALEAAPGWSSPTHPVSPARTSPASSAPPPASLNPAPKDVRHLLRAELADLRVPAMWSELTLSRAKSAIASTGPGQWCSRGCPGAVTWC